MFVFVRGSVSERASAALTFYEASQDIFHPLERNPEMAARVETSGAAWKKKSRSSASTSRVNVCVQRVRVRTVAAVQPLAVA